ncbi:MAG: M15 family metallopeptidase [Coriobacteriales bacterium]|nr:M15 family metallopeptidase [Coriobacteriales bacterium]
MDKDTHLVSRRDALRLGGTMAAGLGSLLTLSACSPQASSVSATSATSADSATSVTPAIPANSVTSTSNASEADQPLEPGYEPLADASYDATGFVLLTDVVPDIIQEIRYFGTYNFVGDQIDGYQEPVALLCREAADALRHASDTAVAQGYRLKVWDAYRPQRGVNHFERWAQDLEDTRMQAYFYPDLDKSVLFDLGYIDHRSGHARGSAIDLTLFDMATGKEVDTGGPFDFFGDLSHPNYMNVTEDQYRMRMLLRDIMVDAGYLALETEWWHFRLVNEPYPDTYFDFPVCKNSVA